MTEVAAALIWDNGRFLIGRRPANKARGLLWEFVGGKIEPGETGQQALARECMEELGVPVAVGDFYMDCTHEYQDMTVHMTVYHAVITAGVPKLLEHVALKWIAPEEIEQYVFCPADGPVLDTLKAQGAMHKDDRSRI